MMGEKIVIRRFIIKFDMKNKTDPNFFHLIHLTRTDVF